MDLKLSPHEHEELNKISSSFNLDTYTKTLTVKYYLEYRNKVGQIYPERMPLVINCAILAASKSQVLTTVKGETIRGIGISITQLMRGFTDVNKPAFNFDEFVIVLKEFINTVSLAPDVTGVLRGIIENFAFSYTFFIKYSNLFTQLDLKEASTEGEDYFKCLKNFGWLIYVNAKSVILQNQNELVDSFFLLTATIAHLVYHLPNQISINIFEKNGKNIYDKNTKKKNEEAILHSLQELLKLSANGYDDILLHYNSLQNYLSKLIENEVLKSSQVKSFEGMYDPKLLFHNFNKLESYYQKSLNHDDLDERFFIRERKPHTPGKFTPFAKQGAANKVATNIAFPKTSESAQLQTKKQLSSHRMLNYELSEQVTMQTNLNQIKFAANKSTPASPYPRLLPATPMTRALEMYNWFTEKAKIKKSNSGLTPIIDKYLLTGKTKDNILFKANILVEKVLSPNRDKPENSKDSLLQKKLADKYALIVNFYLRVFEELLIQEEKKVKGSDDLETFRSDWFHKALIACSIEVALFVNNNSSVPFARLLEFCDIEAFDFWKIISIFAKFDPQLPYPIKKHLHDLESKILMSLAWRKNSKVHRTVKTLMDKVHDQTDGRPEKCLSIPKSDESPRNSASTDNNQDVTITKSSDTPYNVTPDQKSWANTTVLLNTTQSETKIQEEIKGEIDPSYEMFFKRVLHFTALQVFQLCDLLHLSEKTAEQVWTTMKYILSSEVDLIIGRHIEQLILCSIYGICKISNQPLKFQDIITRYQDLPSFNKNDFFEIVHQVHIEKEERADLIRFYNSIFINYTRTFLFSLLPDHAQVEIKSATPLIKKPVIKALVMESPLRESLPHSMMQYTNRGSYTHKTSPLLASGKLHEITNLVSKRQINFDEAHEGNLDMTTSSSKRSNKFPYSTYTTMDEIIEQKTEDNEMDSNKKVSSKRNLFGVSNQSGLKKAISFEEQGSNNGGQPSSLPITFSQMVQPKSQIGFNPIKSAKINLESVSVTQTSPPSGQNVQACVSPQNIGEKSGIGKALRKVDLLAPEAKK